MQNLHVDNAKAMEQGQVTLPKEIRKARSSRRTAGWRFAVTTRKMPMLPGQQSVDKAGNPKSENKIYSDAITLILPRICICKYFSAGKMAPHLRY